MRRTAVTTVGAALLFAACGRRRQRARRHATATPGTATETATETQTTASAKLAIAADPAGMLEFTETDLTTDAGEVEIDFTNPSHVPHAVDSRSPVPPPRP